MRDRDIIKGWTGCNAYAGRYSTSGDGSFVIENLQKTEAGCPNIEMFDQEETYVDILVNAEEYDLSFLRLAIISSNNKVIILVNK